MMRLLRALCLVFTLACSMSCSSSSPPAVPNVQHLEVLPLFNRHIRASSVSPREKRINPALIATPREAIVDGDDKTIRVESLSDEVVYKDLIIQSAVDLGDVEITVDSIDNSGITVTPRLVTSWFQAGFTTSKRKSGGDLTYELLLSDDRQDPGAGNWIKSEQGGWIYNPPEILLDDMLQTSLAATTPKRLLLRIAVSGAVEEGVYRTELVIRQSARAKGIVGTIPLEIAVSPVPLTRSLDDRYTLALYTALKISQAQERPGAYVNTMRLLGTQSERQTLLQAYLEDIRSHGFNSITINDWDKPSLAATLDAAQELGYRDVIVHATSPTKRRHKSGEFPIVNEDVIEQFASRNMDALFYGYDEAGGNKRLAEQLSLNRKIHQLGGKSVNAIFWDDLPKVEAAIGADQSRCFDVIAHSLGSHGHEKMLRGLPFKKNTTTCPGSDTKHLVYWHPHVENPTVNRLFMGFWLWASGFDGVIPHGYYFPSHIEKVLSAEDRRQGVSTAASPYDDWSYWLPGETLRHHNAVYPSKAGPVGTLQWEGILNGYTDLRYVVTLEEALERENIEAETGNGIRALLNEIRAEVLKIRSPYLSDTESLRYLQQLEGYKSSIAGWLKHIAAREDH